MNNIIGKVEQIYSSGSVLIVDIGVGDTHLSAMLIDSEEQKIWLKPSNKVAVLFKETEVSLAKELVGRISLRNRFECTIGSVDKGELLSKVELLFREYHLYSVITTRSANYLELQSGERVEALIKANEISLMKI